MNHTVMAQTRNSEEENHDQTIHTATHDSASCEPAPDLWPGVPGRRAKCGHASGRRLTLYDLPGLKRAGAARLSKPHPEYCDAAASRPGPRIRASRCATAPGARASTARPDL